jgi:hypothetical protein
MSWMGIDPSMKTQRIVVAIGPALGGKSTFCNHIDDFATFSFATPLYQMLAVVAGADTVKAARNANQKSDPVAALCGKSLREGLQTIGTEWGRNLIGEDVWIQHLLRRAEHAPRIAIDDLRFPNEYEEMRRRGAVFVRLLPFAALRKDGWQGHVSESHWRTFKVHKEVNWNTREDLVAAAREFCPADFIGVEPSV